MDLKLDAQYWNTRYIENTDKWDIGYPSPAITNYFDKIIDKEVRILIPGCGSAYEGEYLINKGFKNVVLLDSAEEPKKKFLERTPSFDNFIIEDFFNYKGDFDYIIEQTFFCALNPKLRENYAFKMKELLGAKGKLVGLLFNAELNSEHPPFGGFKSDYENLFQKHFKNIKIEETKESIIPRLGKELFIEIC